MTRKAPGYAAAATAGRALGAVFRIFKVARPVRPIHPEGVALHGELTRTGSPAEPSGVQWLDNPGTDTVQARFSRSVGLPHKLPDILGLALRCTPSSEPWAAAAPGTDAPAAHVPGQDSPQADLLFSSTGWRLPGRFLLIPKRDAASAAFTTMMPYRGSNGPVLLGLRTADIPPGSFEGGSMAAAPLADADWVLELHWARPGGPWRPCGELRLRAPRGAGDTPLRFNPLQNQPPGAETYAWTRLLREPSYKVAQQPGPAGRHPGR